jgi:phosphoribosyl 1,2-cyclic phosphodiesterase
LINFASGSGGNCSLLSLNGRHFLIDCGVSHRRMSTGLAGLGLTTDDIEAVIVTHVHSDHVSALPAWYRLSGLRFVFTKSAMASVVEHLGAHKDIGERIFSFIPGEDYSCGDVIVRPFRVSHDAPDTVGLAFQADNKRFTYMTDLGCAVDSYAQHCSGADLVFIEANHEPQMVADSSYPAFLKKRILSDKGHLSNEQSLTFLTSLPKLPGKVLFGHLSRNNNTPERLQDRITQHRLPQAVSEIAVADQFSETSVGF